MKSKFKITKAEGKTLSEVIKEMEGFAPFACLNCHNQRGLVSTFFIVDRVPESAEEERELKEQMRNEFGVEDFGVSYGGGKGAVLTCARCPNCGSQDAFWDF